MKTDPKTQDLLQRTLYLAAIGRHERSALVESPFALFVMTGRPSVSRTDGEKGDAERAIGASLYGASNAGVRAVVLPRVLVGGREFHGGRITDIDPGGTAGELFLDLDPRMLPAESQSGAPDDVAAGLLATYQRGAAVLLGSGFVAEDAANRPSDSGIYRVAWDVRDSEDGPRARVGFEIEAGETVLSGRGACLLCGSAQWFVFHVAHVGSETRTFLLAQEDARTVAVAIDRLVGSGTGGTKRSGYVEG